MLVAYTVSLDLIRSLRPVVEQLRRHSSEAARQVTDAASSIAHNIAEGSHRSGGDIRRFYVMANGSAAEIRAALDVADAWGWKVDTAESRRVLDRLLGLLHGLTRERRSAEPRGARA